MAFAEAINRDESGIQSCGMAWCIDS
jgi:hypothetical protein